MPKFNDFDMKKWKEYDDIDVSSLWIIDRRKKDDLNENNYHGNYIPQIPEHFIKRFTKQGEIVIDPFVGSGTTIFEAIHNKRRAIGIDLNKEIVELINSKISMEDECIAISADSASSNTITQVKSILNNNYGVDKAQLLALHPPYHNIIRFSEDPNDLSNCNSVSDFVERFSKLVDLWLPLLEDGRYLYLVIGDLYQNSQLVPLSAYCLNELLQKDLTLKGTIIKNTVNTRAQQGQSGLWRYRALNSDYYLFEHEYIYVFRKN